MVGQEKRHTLLQRVDSIELMVNFVSVSVLTHSESLDEIKRVSEGSAKM
jgi:hypothetical protein